MQLSHIRPLSVGEILDGAFTLYRRHFGQFFLAAFLPQLPIILLWLVWGPVMGTVVGEDADMGAALLAIVFGVAVLVFSLLAYLLPAGTLTRMAADAYLGNPVSRAESTRVGWGKLLPVLGVSILMGVGIMLGLLACVIPAFLVIIVFFAGVPAVVLEGENPVDALSRSHHLAKGAWGEIFVVQVVFWLITLIPTFGVSMLATLAVALSATTETAALSVQGISNAMQALTTAVTMPLTMIGTTLLYYDRRVRSEAFGLEADLNALETA